MCLLLMNMAGPSKQHYSLYLVCECKATIQASLKAKVMRSYAQGILIHCRLGPYSIGELLLQETNGGFIEQSWYIFAFPGLLMAPTPTVLPTPCAFLLSRSDSRGRRGCHRQVGFGDGALCPQVRQRDSPHPRLESSTCML